MTPKLFKDMKEIKNNQGIQSSFFLYDRSNILKKTFVNEINEFVLLVVLEKQLIYKILIYFRLKMHKNFTLKRVL